uniref:Uncharacterized protein n=1 Tax=Arundo donax TaxID=35708 RepID=A0A0A9QK91_ARUDO
MMCLVCTGVSLFFRSSFPFICWLSNLLRLHLANELVLGRVEKRI